MEPIVYVELDRWIAASHGDAASIEAVDKALFAYLARQTESGRRGHGSLGRDVLNGRRSEIEFINGMIAAKGEELGVPVPIHRGLTEIVKRIDAGVLKPHPDNIAALVAAAQDQRRKK